MDSLKDIMKQGKLSPEGLDEVRKLLMVSFQLNTLLMNTWCSLENVFKRHGYYVFEIKHNHKQIKNLIRHKYSGFWENLSEQQIDTVCGDADELERLVYKWAGLPVEEQRNDND